MTRLDRAVLGIPANTLISERMLFQEVRRLLPETRIEALASALIRINSEDPLVTGLIEESEGLSLGVAFADRISAMPKNALIIWGKALPPIPLAA